MIQLRGIVRPSIGTSLPAAMDGELMKDLRGKQLHENGKNDSAAVLLSALFRFKKAQRVCLVALGFHIGEESL